MVETGISSATAAKKPSMTPKAIIHQRFGDKACYKVEEVQDTTKGGCPGLAIPQKGPSLYRCTLKLPEITVVSDTFKRKKDAEQSAAELAIAKLGIGQKEYNPTVQEAWEDLADRVAFLFADQFLSSSHPLGGHLRAALRRDGALYGSIPVSVIAVYDTRTSNICKHISPISEANSVIMVSLIMQAAAKLTELVTITQDQLSLKRLNPYPAEIIESTNHDSNFLCSGTPVEAVLIPASMEKDVASLTLNITLNSYYLDVIARELGFTEASDLLISRTIGRASSEMRIYSSFPKRQTFGPLSDPQVHQSSNHEGPLNIRATYFSGQEVYGDAILASIGYTWRSGDLFHEAASLHTYYRMLVNKTPSGAYKISREALVAAKLPSAYTTKGNWRGSLPRDILCTLCRLHHLSEPVFSIHNVNLNSSLDLPNSHKKLKIDQSANEEKSGTGRAGAIEDTAVSVGAFICEVKMYSKNHVLILHCSPQESHRKQTDAMQSAALNVLSWLNKYFEKPNTSVEELLTLGEKLGIHFTPDYFFKEFALCPLMHGCGTSATEIVLHDKWEDEPSLVDIRGQSAEATPCGGSLACISYTVTLLKKDHAKEYVESCEEFEFEVGTEAVSSHIEAAVVQMNVGQSASFQSELPPRQFILAAGRDSSAMVSFLSSGTCKLEYSVTLLQVTEPLEERMEQALFSPPLSKQRVEFAVRRIEESSAKYLIDFGCGSGSLLDSLLQYPTSLEHIVGVDISQKALARAAKSLNLKLSNLCKEDPSCKIKSAVLYDGSITTFDSRLRGCDIATCLEVIEHMQEEDACLFGNIVLTSFCPKILVVSTPNYEYNVILQKSAPLGHEEDIDEKNQTQTCKFRNHDHKFEWTREQFGQWASDLAVKHNYSVEFSGVGGDGDKEPGFASQIAIFTRQGDDDLENVEFAQHYAPIWEWSRDGMDTLTPSKAA